MRAQIDSDECCYRFSQGLKSAIGLLFHEKAVCPGHFPHRLHRSYRVWDCGSSRSFLQQSFRSKRGSDWDHHCIIFRNAIYLLAGLGAIVRPIRAEADLVDQHGGGSWIVCFICFEFRSGKSYGSVVVDGDFANVRWYMRWEYHGRSGLHCGYHSTRTTLEKNGADRDGVWVGVHFWPGYWWRELKVSRQHGAWLGGCGALRGEFPSGIVHLVGKSEAEFRTRGRKTPIESVRHTLSQPKVGLLVVVFFFATFCFSCFESTLALMVTDNFHLNIQRDVTSASTVVYLFAYCGIIGALVQGGAIGRMVRKMGEPRLIALSLVFTAISLAMLPFIKGSAQLSWGVLFRPEGLPWVAMLGALAMLSIGSSLTRPPLFGLLSNLTSAHEQGATIGVAQSAGSLARILGPIYATALLHYMPPLPYLTCTAVLLGTTIVVVQKLCTTDESVVARTNVAS